MKKNRKQRGFTLIEILVVLIIISIITAVAVMAFQGFGRDRRARMAVYELQSIVELAQQRSMVQGIILGMKLTEQGYQFFLYQPPKSKQASAWQSLPSDNLSDLTAFPDNLTYSIELTDHSDHLPIHLGKKDSATILFLPDGFLTPFVMTFHFGGKTMKLSVDSLGQIKVTSP